MGRQGDPDLLLGAAAGGTGLLAHADLPARPHEEAAQDANLCPSSPGAGACPRFAASEGRDRPRGSEKGSARRKKHITQY